MKTPPREPLSIRWERRAVRELKALPAKARPRVVSAVEELLDDPLKGVPLSGQWKGLRRIRVGTYRVIYAFDGAEFLILVVRVAHRQHAYHP